MTPVHFSRVRAVSALAIVASLCLVNAAIAQGRQPPAEPAYEVIKSGACKVGVCTDYDFGDHVFRIYADERAETLRVIPSGACSCQRVIKAGKPRFNNFLTFGVETAEGRLIRGISLSRVGAAAGANVETTYEEFKRLESELEPAAGLSWIGRFAAMNAFQTKPVPANGARRYFFVPKEPAYLDIGGTRQPVAFSTPLRVIPTERRTQDDGPTVAARFRYSPSSSFFQFFTPRVAYSERWVGELQNTVRFLQDRMTPVAEPD